MKINPIYIITASKEVLSRKSYLMAFIALVFIIITIFISIPIFLIPANSLLFQLTVFTIKDYLLLTVLSILTSLIIVMQVFSYKNAKFCSPEKTAVSGGSAFVAALFGTASCSACLAAVFGFLGIGTVFFLVGYQWFIVGIAILIMLISLYFTSLKLKRVYESCKK